MEEMSKDYERCKEMVIRYDEVLSHKANKMAIDEVAKYAAETYLRNTIYQRQQDQVD